MTRPSREQKSKRRHYSRQRVQEFSWAGLSDEQLLEYRFCDLGLTLAGTQLEPWLDQLYEELSARGIRLRPHCWLSDDWFSPDGVPGIAIPFYMAHPRLMRLERVQMLEVEGGNREWCLRILRHEAGHAIDTAYRLHRRKRYREVFGRYSDPYPEYYRPRPNSKSYVIHLEPHYAQSHPSEDFAETFAVWLNPRNNWRKDYAGWRALKKLELMDELIGEIAGEPPRVRSRAHVDPLRQLKKTLGEHYAERHERYQVEPPRTFENELRKLFSRRPRTPQSIPAAQFLAAHRGELCRAIAQGTGELRYNVNQLLGEMIRHCQEQQLFVNGPETEALHDALSSLTAYTVNYLHGGHHRVAL